jgi:predicted hydrocarbon binding protein
MGIVLNIYLNIYKTEENYMNTDEHKQQVQGFMMFLGAIADGLESVTGKGAGAVCFLAGRKVGLRRKVAQKENDIMATLETVKNEMKAMDINWPFDIDDKQQSEFIIQHDGYREIKLPFKNCIVRCTLFRYGVPQGKALCQTKHGLFCGLFENIYGAKTNLGIIHAGENACLLNLKIFD